MAKTWLMGEAARAIRDYDKEAVIDIGKRFPLTANLLAKLNDAGVALCEAIPANITVRKVEAILKGDISVDETEEVEDSTEEGVDVPFKKKRNKKEKPVKEEKKRGRKAKKPVVEEDENEDDEEEDELVKKPAKKAKKEDKKVAKKPAKKVVEEDEDDDDDFDFDLDDDDDE